MQKRLQAALKNLVDTLWEIEDKKLLKDFLEDILTPKEIIEIKERVEIIKLLKKKIPQREIAEKLWVSITTVNRWSRILKWGTWAAWIIVDKFNNLN